jgi:hypothetical protein
MKPLYVQGTGTRVERDGPALKVACPERAERWFPLRRISQVVSSAQVAWSTPALLACAEEGITVSFLAEDGAIVARVVGRPGERDELRQRWGDFLLRPDWRTLYEQWLAGMEQMAVRSVVRRAGFAPADVLTARALRRMFREAAESMELLPAFERIGGDVHGLLVALATQRLAEAGIAVDFEGVEGPRLAVDFASILFWDFQLARLAWLEDRLRQDSLDAPGREEIVAFFEARRDRIGRLAAGLVNRLHRWLVELY